LFKASIKIKLKRTILDPQGKTIEHALETLGYDKISDVRVGKYIELGIDAGDEDEARRILDEICEKFLSNPVIEEYSFTIEKNSS
jgi:phosphoribosylformylglycinamidine synthase